MKKPIFSMFLAVLLIMSVSAATFANQNRIIADNGMVLDRSTIGLDLYGLFAVSISDSELYDYGVEMSLGALDGLNFSVVSEKINDYRRVIGKVYLSPTYGSEGYTVYLGYDFKNRELAMVGGTIWAETNYFRLFLNVDSDRKIDGERLATFTPGFNFSLNSGFHIVSEVEIDMSELESTEMRFGVICDFSNNAVGKFILTEEVESETVKMLLGASFIL